MATLLGTIRNYTCTYVDKRVKVAIITDNRMFLTVPVLGREARSASNAVLAFLCPSHAQAALDAEVGARTWGSTGARVSRVDLETLHEFSSRMHMSTVVISGAQCELPFGSGNGRGHETYDLAYLPPKPSTSWEFPPFDAAPQQ